MPAFNEFLAKVGHPPIRSAQFFEASPRLNLLLYPEPLQLKRRHRSIPEALPISGGLCPRRGPL